MLKYWYTAVFFHVSLVLSFHVLAETSSSLPTLAFNTTSGGNENYFIRDNVTSAQLVLTGTNTTGTTPRRLIVALPAGNSGALTYLLPADGTQSSSLSIQLVEGSLRSVTQEYDNVGVQADLLLNQDATLGVTIIGAVRAMRDYVEGDGTMHEIFNYTLLSYNETFVHLHRQWINSTADDPSQYKGADLLLSIPSTSSTRFFVQPGNNGTYAPPIVEILTGNASDVFRVAVLTNETSPVGLNPQTLFLLDSVNGTQGLKTSLHGLANGTNFVANETSFLTYTDKFTAGGWRFLTYFGRDTLIAVRLLMPLLTPEAIESALGAVVERANATGALCHEETIGDYASFINIQNNQSYLGNQPFYDYKMIDTDLLLLPALSHYFLELPQGQGRSPHFLERSATLQNGTYAEILMRNALYNFERAQPFTENPVYSNLIGLRPGQPVGNWRDSNQGLAYGFYPFDVNTALVPASLRATENLLNAGILSNATLNASAVAAVADVWEEHAPRLFEVTVSAPTAERYLQDFVRSANLSQALLCPAEHCEPQTAEITFYALSLMADGTPVEVMNSDMGFNLVYGTNVSQDFLQQTIEALQRYPRGLLTNIGMVVANPAYDSNRTNIEVLDRAAYHGTVVWSFQQGLMANGIARQLSFCRPNNATAVDTNVPSSSRPSWCANQEFVQSLKDAQTRLWTSINGAREEVNSEVWSYSFDNTTNAFAVADLASLSPDGTESDAIQLWSYGFLGLIDPTTNKTIAS